MSTSTKNPAFSWTGLTSQVQRHPVASLTLLYVLVVLPQATLKLLWADELITFYISQAQGIGGVWRALAAGADPNPPLLPLLVKFSLASFGHSALALRLPSMICGGLTIAAMWWILKQWVQPIFAVAGVLTFMATRGFDYAYDARSYALLLAFSIGALAFWIRAGQVEGTARAVAWSAMALSLAAAISSNYYGVLALVPISIGEAVYTFDHRRLRFGSWSALVVAAAPLFFYLPLIQHDLAEFEPHAWNPPRLSMIGSSYLELVEGIFWPVAALGIYVAYRRRSRGPIIPREDRAALWVLVLYPFVGFSVAVAGRAMISPRCVIPVCCGFGFLASILLQRLFRRFQHGGVWVALVLLLWVVTRQTVCATVLFTQRQAFFRLCDQISRTRGERVLVGDSSLVLPLSFYSQPAVQRRIVFPIDFDAIHCYEQDDSGEQNLWAGRHGLFPFPVAAFSDLSLGHGTWSVVARPNGWLAQNIKRKNLCLTASAPSPDWKKVGGVFTPMAHPETTILEEGCSQP